MFDLIIFDLDGVLVDSEPIANRVLLDHLQRLGVPVTFDELFRDFVGLSLPTCYALVERRYGVRVPEGFTETLQCDTFARYRRELKPVPGVPDMLARLGGPKCVASSSEPEKIALSLDLTSLRSHFDGHLFSAQHVARGKPHPDLFLHAARQMAVAPPRAAVIEDSVPGVQAGMAAGMCVFAYVGGSHVPWAALQQAGACLFDDMAALPELLRSAA